MLPPTVHYPGSYVDDLGFDMRANTTASGGGIAYIVDWSNEGRTGFVMIGLGTVAAEPTPEHIENIRWCTELQWNTLLPETEGEPTGFSAGRFRWCGTEPLR